MIRQLLTYRDGCTDPHRNLATEAYLTETVPEDTCILYLWQNRHTVVIGRNQNAWRECRTTLLEQEGGVLARRLSGGGAVYHDMGNLNFTFSLPTADYDLRRQQEVLVAACRRLGIPAECSGRNDILTGGRKFSGNSFYHHGGRSFHNGTLLIDVDMEKLGRYLAPSQGKLESKGVASVRSRVVNLSQIQPGLTVSHMEEALWAAFSEVYGLPTRRLEPSQLDQAALERHYQCFHSYDWVYGQAMPCTFSCGERFPWGELTLELAVEGGVCRHAAVWTDAMDEGFAQPLARGLRAALPGGGPLPPVEAPPAGRWRRTCAPAAAAGYLKGERLCLICWSSGRAPVAIPPPHGRPSWDFPPPSWRSAAGAAPA
ncbi:MAG: lipoate--protein ligase [Oscillospiraceae bacterium]